MSDWLMKVIRAEAKQLIALAADDEELRADLRALAGEILSVTEAQRAGSEPLAPETSGSATVESTETRSESTTLETVEPLRELTLGRSVSAKGEMGIAPTNVARAESTSARLAEIEARCRLRGAAGRWAVERLLRIREGNDRPDLDAPTDPRIVEWAGKMTDCFYWVHSTGSSEHADLALLENAAGCFESLAEGLENMRDVLEKHQGTRALERMLPLVAEAQSALRAALKKLNAPDDGDQLEVFDWVKTTAAHHRVYLKRYMRVDDGADPAGWSDLLARIEAATAGGQLTRQQSSELEQIGVRLKQIEAGENVEQEWQLVVEMVDRLVASGVPPSNRELRNALLSRIECLPERDDLPSGFRRVVCEIDRYLSLRSSATRHSVSQAAVPEVVEAARLLHGRSAVLIGGIRRRVAQDSLRRALSLGELIWVETKEHQSIDSFEPIIARASVAVVLLAIRWSSHAFGDVKEFCDRHNKPLVRLPGGYSPNQIAAQIMAQCSGKLEGSRAPAQEVK
jgi:hypothetical protein